MADENDRFWKEIKGKVRRAFDLNPMCREEAEEEARRAKQKKPMADGDVDAIMEYVLSWGQKGGMTVPPEESEEEEDGPAEWVDPVTPEMMEDEVLLLNSNPGEKDDETQALIEKMRREALGDDTSDDNSQDPPGPPDGEKPSGTSH